MIVLHTEPKQILLCIAAAWDTYMAGYITLEQFADVMRKYDKIMNHMARYDMAEKASK